MPLTLRIPKGSPLSHVESDNNLTYLEGAMIKKDGTVTFTGNQNLGGNRFTNMGAPVNSNDAVRLLDLQTVQSGLYPKAACRLATTTNITLSGPYSLDGISTNNGDRVLVKNQTNPAENGIYVVDSFAWTRATDANTSPQVLSGMYVFVNEGNTMADSGWILSTDGTIVLGTTNLTFVPFSINAITVSGILTKSGNNISLLAVHEIPTGLVNGVNTSFQISTILAIPSTFQLFIDGLLKDGLPGTPDYSLVGNILTIFTAPTGGQKLRVYYNI